MILNHHSLLLLNTLAHASVFANSNLKPHAENPGLGNGFFPLSFKKYLFERQESETERERDGDLTHTTWLPHGYNTQPWASLMPGIRNSFFVSHTGGKPLSIWPPSVAFQGASPVSRSEAMWPGLELSLWYGMTSQCFNLLQDKQAPRTISYITRIFWELMSWFDLIKA